MSGSGWTGVSGGSEVGVSGNGFVGVQGISSTTFASATGEGVFSSSSPGISSAAVLGQNSGTGSQGIGVWGQHTGSGIAVYGAVGTSGGYAVRGFAPHGNGYALCADGDFAATGTKSALVPAEAGYSRKLYCMESPECWFEDFGSGLLVAGIATVRLDPAFAATVRTDQYHVFLTPHGDSSGLFVGAVDAAGFTVREQRGGRSSLSFSYRIVARRRDVVAPRLERVTIAVPPVITPRPAAPPPPVAAEQASASAQSF